MESFVSLTQSDGEHVPASVSGRGDVQKDDLLEATSKVSAVTDAWRRRVDRLTEKRDGWLELVTELGWAAAWKTRDGSVELNAPARNEVARLTGKPSSAEAREWFALVALVSPEAIRARSEGLIIWRPAGAEGSPLVVLSAREAEILDWMREGKRAHEIAVILGLSRRTVESHQARIYRKLGVRNFRQAILSAAHRPPAAQLDHEISPAPLPHLG